MASEIATLKLNADWVVLSACNTAAGSGEGAEALSGLARAFFYAGARALLVRTGPSIPRPPPVTTGTLATLAATPEPRPRRSLPAAPSSTWSPKASRPAYWAPFVVVGERGRSDGARP